MQSIREEVKRTSVNLLFVPAEAEISLSAAQSQLEAENTNSQAGKAIADLDNLKLQLPGLDNTELKQVVRELHKFSMWQLGSLAESEGLANQEMFAK